jgi:thiol reductant ABC exporter CydC subunit
MNSLRRTAGLPRGERARLVLAITLSAGAAGAAIALLSTSGYLISRAAQRPEILSLMVTIVAVRTFGLARAGLRYAERLASHGLALRQLARLRASFFARLVPLVPGNLNRRGRGDLLTRFVSDVDAIGDVYLRVIIPIIVATAVIIGCALAGSLMFAPLGIALAATLLLDAALSPWLARRASASAMRRQARARGELAARFVETVDGAAELAVAGASTAAVDDLTTRDAELAQLARRDGLVSGAATTVHGLTGAAAILAVLLLGSFAVSGHRMSGVLVASSVFLCLAAREATGALGQAGRRWNTCAVAAGRLQEVCAEPPAIRDPDRPTPRLARGSLTAWGITSGYGPAEPPVLRDLDVTLSRGERVALIGESGSGKTTLAELLVRFRDPELGQVTLDGVDLRALSQNEIRRDVLLCEADGHLFNTSLAQNLRIGDPEASDADLWEALSFVELADWARALPHGLRTGVGQFGERVSGGQRQRIALARALLSPARFLILDEPTAHLDAEMGERILERLMARRGDQGILLITHDHQHLTSFDRVLLLAEGRVSEGAATSETTP